MRSASANNTNTTTNNTRRMARMLLGLTVILAVLATLTPAASAQEGFVSAPLLREFETHYLRRSDSADVELAFTRNRLDQETPLLIEVLITGDRYREAQVLEGRSFPLSEYGFRFEGLSPGQYTATAAFTYVEANKKPSLTFTFEVFGIPGIPNVTPISGHPAAEFQSADIEWEAPQHGEVSEYRVMARSGGTDKLATVDGATLNTTISYIPADYDIWVEAVMVDGTSRLSPKLNIDLSRAAVNPPPAPTPVPAPPAPAPAPPAPTPVPTPAPAADTIAPTVTIQGPSTVSRYGAPAPITYSCDDNVAVASCTGNVDSGHIIDTSVLGQQTFTAEATDTSGNTATDTHSVDVDWKLTGRYAGVTGNEGIVARYYAATFRRLPDAGGFQHWVDLLASSPDAGETVAQFFVTSTEFTETYGSGISDAEFVDTIYRNVLGRTPEAGGRAFWLELLSSGSASRGDVMRGFADSPEHRDITGTN